MLHRRKSYVASLVVILLLNVCLCGPLLASLGERIDKAVGKAKASQYAIQIVEADSGNVIYSHNATKALIPASNMKLITTAAALHYLGPLFEYETRIGLSGETLVIIGSGDPLLGDEKTDTKYGRDIGWIFEEIVQAFQERGIESVNDIIVDSTIFDDERVHPNWPASDLNRWYACEVCGINYNDNCIEVRVENRNGQIAIDVMPTTSFIEVLNEVKAVSEGDSAVGAYRNTQPNRISIRGRCKRAEGPFFVAIEQPAAFFGFLVAENLARAGIPATGRLIEKGFDPNGGFVEVARFKTPLIECFNRSNKNSLGLVPEALLKTIAAHRDPNGRDGSWEGGRKLVGDYLRQLGIPEEEFVIDDGSGLSRENRLSTRGIMAVLLDLYNGGNWEYFRTSLAVGGRDGTIEGYFKEPAYRDKVLAKTGYVRGVRSLSGVCLTDRGPYLFSILSNQSTLSRSGINGIAEAIIDEYQEDD